MESTAIKFVNISELKFDQKNPRLVEVDLGSKPTDFQIIEELWTTMDVQELVLSIANSGYFPHEPIIIEKDGKSNTVIEGNRRLAAVKIILDSDLAGNLNADVPIINSDMRQSLQQLPTILGTRKEAWRYLGFKHVNGPAKWGSYAKSKYIADVHNEYNITLEEIARQIGDTHKTVQRLYRGLMVIEQAEREEVFNREDRYMRHFSFSHLYTGVTYPGIRNFLSMPSEKYELKEPVPMEKIDELGELCLWMYGSKKSDIRPLVQSQNPYLRQLDTIVGNVEALSALRSGTDIRHAFELTRPSSTIFQESLVSAKQGLVRARGALSLGYDGTEELREIAYDVKQLSTDLCDEMDSIVEHTKT